MNDFAIEIELITQTDGDAVFDPYNLERFCLTHNITTANLEDFFSKNEALGNLVIKSGVIIPSYNGRPETCRIIVSNKRMIKKENQKFIARNKHLEIISGKLAICDVGVLRMWQAGHYKSFTQGAPAYHLLDVPSGMYRVDVIGFNRSYDFLRGLSDGGNDSGYNYVLKRSER
jgi:hypothetical protein